MSGTGHWSGYLAFIRHPAVALELASYHLGSSDQAAEHWLVIDRQDRVGYIALKIAGYHLGSSVRFCGPSGRRPSRWC